MTTRDNPEVLDNDENSPGGLRATIDRLNEKIDDQDKEIGGLQGEKRDRALDDSGLDGPALKAVKKDLERDEFTGDLTAAGLREYAEQEYDWTPPDGDDKPGEIDDATEKRMASADARDDLAASSHARGDSEPGPEAQQAEVDRKLEEGDIQGAVFDELKNKVSRVT